MAEIQTNGDNAIQQSNLEGERAATNNLRNEAFNNFTEVPKTPHESGNLKQGILPGIELFDSGAPKSGENLGKSAEGSSESPIARMRAQADQAKPRADLGKMTAAQAIEEAQAFRAHSNENSITRMSAAQAREAAENLRATQKPSADSIFNSRKNFWNNK